MAFVITDECLSCGSCAAQCPAEAIEMGDLHYEIDADKCLECGACAAVPCRGYRCRVICSNRSGGDIYRPLIYFNMLSFYI